MSGPHARALRTAFSLACATGALGVGCAHGNRPPIAKVGTDQSVKAGARVTLDGSGSRDPEREALTFSWAQTLGAPVELDDEQAAKATFRAPTVGSSLTFELTVSDGPNRAVGRVRVSVQPVAGTGQVKERRQPSVEKDVAVTGAFPSGWSAGPPVPSTGDDEDEEDHEPTRYAPIVETNLGAGATRTVELDVAGRTGLAASARWTGTRAPLSVSLAFDGTPFPAGRTYAYAHDRGGAYVEGLAPSAGRATLSVTNTSGVTVHVRLALGGRALP
jgi:hypothetical protein